MTTARPASPTKSAYMIGPRLKYALGAAGDAQVTVSGYLVDLQ